MRGKRVSSDNGGYAFNGVPPDDGHLKSVLEQCMGLLVKYL